LNLKCFQNFPKQLNLKFFSKYLPVPTHENLHFIKSRRVLLFTISCSVQSEAGSPWSGRIRFSILEFRIRGSIPYSPMFFIFTVYQSSALVSVRIRIQLFILMMIQIRIRIQDAKPMRIREDPDPNQTLKSRKVEFLHEKYA
jgi:hypothetical protein